MGASEHCIFCRIAAGRAPAVVVCDDPHTLAFMDLAPASPGHCLIIPRRHFSGILDIDDEAAAVVACAARRVACAVQAALAPAGLRVVQLNGHAAGQTVFHYHLHVIPVDQAGGGGFHGRVQAATGELESVARRIRSALE